MKLFKILIFIVLTFRFRAKENDSVQKQDDASSQQKLSYWDQIVHSIDVAHKGKPKINTLNEFGLMSIKKNEYNHIKAYLIMKRKAKQKSKEYISCVDKISNASFSTDNIELCVGKDFQLLKYDFEYQKKLLKAQTSRQLRHIIFEECYKHAGLDLEQSQSCDLFQKDTLDMLWEGINFYKILLDNEEQYVSLIGQMDLHVYENLILKIKTLYDEYDNLIDSLIQQKESVMFNIKSHIDDRTTQIVHRAEIDSTQPKPLIFTHHIDIRESLNGPGTSEHSSRFSSSRLKSHYDIPTTDDDMELLDYGSETIDHDKQDQLRKQNMYMNTIINEFPPAMVRDKVRKQFGSSYIAMFDDDEVKK